MKKRRIADPKSDTIAIFLIPNLSPKIPQRGDAKKIDACKIPPSIPI
jgi:hypothetical protein